MNCRGLKIPSKRHGVLHCSLHFGTSTFFQQDIFGLDRDVALLKQIRNRDCIMSGKKSTSKLGFYVLFNSQGYIRTGPQHLLLVGVEPTQR